jgi:alkylation response protein AidB-like acyl-CoA dehydrogenase
MHPPMEVTLTDDQEFFRDTTRRFLESECPLTTVRELRSTPAEFERDYWRQGAELGWMSLLVPEDLGGGSISGRGVADLTLVADAFGRFVSPGPLLPANLVAAALARSGTADQQATTLSAVMAGELVPAWCVPYPGAPPTAGVTASTTADGFVLEGAVPEVEAAAQADVLLVTARLDDGDAQFLIPAATPGVTVTPLDGLDLVRRFAAVAFDNVVVSPTDAVGTPGDSGNDVERQRQLALVIQTSEMVGAAATVFDFTVEWAFNRYSFGRPLASYQELKHRFADMKTWLEASHAIADAAAREVQNEVPTAGTTASIAKAYIGDYVPELVQDCVQMHGGIGVTYEHDLHLFLRRVIVDRVTHGAPGDHRQLIGSKSEVYA